MTTLAEKWIKDGLEQGREQGLEQGLEQGRRQGSIATAQALLLEVLDARFGSTAVPLRERIRRIEDLAVLTALHKAAGSPEAFEDTLHASTGR